MVSLERDTHFNSQNLQWLIPYIIQPGGRNSNNINNIKSKFYYNTKRWKRYRNFEHHETQGQENLTKSNTRILQITVT